jgi:hypothetical protein
MSDLFDAAAEREALASGKALSQVRAELVFPVPQVIVGSLLDWSDALGLELDAD